jgi:hypothetical protein
MLNIDNGSNVFLFGEHEPYVVKGLIDGKMGMVISQDPTKASSVTSLEQRK